MNFTGKKVLVVGLARSGLAAIKALHRQGADLSAFDIKKPEQISEIIKEIKNMGVTIYAGFYPRIETGSFDIVVASPGVSLEVEPIKSCISLGIPVMGEVELAYLLKSPNLEMIAVSGTNGKTTTTSLLHYILQESGRKSIAGGNIGVPLTSLVYTTGEGVIVVEVSSFQLETTIDFKPHIAGLLNITPDHLDRHKTFDNYINTKARIFTNQTDSDFAILNYEDDNIRDMAARCRAKVIFFSTERVLKQGAFVENNIITVIVEDQKYEICQVKDLLLRGKHNLENILCAATMAIAAGVSPEIISNSLKSFKGIRHRLEEVTSKEGVLYINDSKGTNPDSTIRALESFKEPIILIAGGRNKGSDFKVLANLISSRVKELVLVGEAKEIIKRAVMDTGFKNINEVEDFPSAVRKAHELAYKGDVVLLSPACASWDMFDNYEQRGDLFCELVKQL